MAKVLLINGSPKENGNTFAALSELRPELFFASRFHFTITLGAGVLIPHPDFITAALQAKAPHLTAVRRSHIGYDATHHQVLDSVAVGA